MLTTALLSLPLAIAASGFAEAKALADANEAALPADQVNRLLQVQGRFLESALGACARPGMDLSRFTLVFTLDPDGRVLATWREGDTPLARCMHEQLKPAAFPGEWPQPFYTSIVLTLTE